MTTFHYISHFAEPWRTERYIADALRWHGVNVECYQVTEPDDRPGKNGAPPVNRGDVVFTAVPHVIGPAVLSRYKEQGAVTACWYFDWLVGWQDRDAAYLPALKTMDVVFSTDGFENDYYTSNGLRRFWLPQACRPDDRPVAPAPGSPRHDAIFVGNLRAGERRDLRRLLADRCDFGHYGGNGRFIWGREFCELVGGSKVVIGVSHRTDVPGYWSNRIYLTLGAGGFYLGRRVPGIDKLFTDGEHCVFWDSHDDLMDKLAYWTKPARDARRRRIAEAGCAHVHCQHNYTGRVETMLAQMRELGLI